MPPMPPFVLPVFLALVILNNALSFSTLILINSHHNHTALRSTILATFATRLPPDTSLLFVVGVPELDACFTPHLNETSHILTVPVTDLYRNNIMKLLSFFQHYNTIHKHISKHATFDYVVKLDDDTYIDPAALISSLPTPPQTLYRGLSFTGVPVRSVKHKVSS